MKSPEETPEQDLGDITCLLHRDEDSSIWLEIEAPDGGGLPTLLLPLTTTDPTAAQEFATECLHIVRGFRRVSLGRHPNLPKHMKAYEADLPGYYQLLLSRSVPVGGN